MYSQHEAKHDMGKGYTERETGAYSAVEAFLLLHQDGVGAPLCAERVQACSERALLYDELPGLSLSANPNCVYGQAIHLGLLRATEVCCGGKLVDVRARAPLAIPQQRQREDGGHNYNGLRPQKRASGNRAGEAPTGEGLDRQPTPGEDMAREEFEYEGDAPRLQFSQCASGLWLAVVLAT